MKMARLISFTIAVGLLAGVLSMKADVGGKPYGAFNLRIVSDSVPDWSSRENFVKSALGGWDTIEDKVLAQVRWLHRCRRVGSCVLEDQRPVVDPILFLNSYGITYCSMMTQINIAMWEAYGLKGRYVVLPGHVVSEVFYNGAWHMFDNDFANYFLKEDGTVASAKELGASRIHGNVEDLEPGEFYIFDHCPTASAPRGHIFQGPNSWWVLDVARDWYPDAEQVQPRNDLSGARAGYRRYMAIRKNESYTRYWQPVGTGKRYARLLKNGKDPMGEGGSTLRNSRGNGVWEWSPDLSDTTVFFDTENIAFNTQGLKKAVQGQPAYGILRVAAADIITSADIIATCSGKVTFKISGNNGQTWHDVDFLNDEASVAEVTVAIPIAGRLEYLLKFDLADEASVKHLKLKTITQLNSRVLPALRIGRNEIAAVSDEHLEYVSAMPLLADNAHTRELYQAEGWQSVSHPSDWDVSLRATKKAEATIRFKTPGDIKSVRFAGSVILDESSSITEISLGIANNWKKMGSIDYAGSPYDKRVEVATREIPEGVKEVKVRCETSHNGFGFQSIFAEAGYAPAGGFMPYDITYCWNEWRENRWVERMHVERVETASQRYVINVGGERPPRMLWIKIEEAKSEQYGYSDGQDVGDNPRRAPYALKYGKNLSLGAPYVINHPPSEAYPDASGCLKNMPRDRLLTDGFIGEGSVWKLIDINLTGKKNENRVGELVAWAPLPPQAPPLMIVVDLGEVKMTGGARVAAIQPNASILYPSKINVSVSEDGVKYKSAGEIAWEEIFFPPSDQLLWEGSDSPIYDHLPAGGMIAYRFPVIFEEQLPARYVRFTLMQPSDPKAGIALYEVDVWDKIEKVPWDERLTLPGNKK